MAFVRPTLDDLVQRISSDFKSRLQLTGALLRRSVVQVLSRIFAGAAHSLYGYIQFLSRQMFPDTAEAEFLKRHGGLFGIIENAATYATGDVVFSGVSGSIVPEGTLLQRADGRQYATDADVTLVADAGTVGITALVAEEAGNADAGTALTFVQPVPGVDSNATVAVGGLSAGNDVESEDALRIRVKERMQNPPHGGARGDYILWAKEVTGVTRAWVYPEEQGPGTVVVRFVRDNDADIIPSSDEVDDVAEYIETKRPVTAHVTVVAPVPVELDFGITVSPNNAAVRAAIQAELEDLLQREAEPGGIILISHIREAISVAASEYDHTITAPTANVEHDTGEIAVMGEITWG